MTNIFEKQNNEFAHRHIGISEKDIETMLVEIGEPSMEQFISKIVPQNIVMSEPLNIPAPMNEDAYLKYIKQVSLKNKIFKSYIGQGYFDTITPAVIQRTIFENPGWYTQYTPYQAEISQGRLESLLNYQTMVSDLCGLPIANASLLDEATAAAEAMTMFFNTHNKQETIVRPSFFIDRNVYTQTKEVLYTRAKPLGINIIEGDFVSSQIDSTYFGALVQYPNAKGGVDDYTLFIEKCTAQGVYIAMATDLLALTLLTPPGELGAHVAIGSSQRYGVPLGYGGPHAGFFATKEEFKRSIPGRIIGVSIDAHGNRALRMALQTREQHIKREKATSNICTAQALLANMAAMYAVYHGPTGLKEIAERVHVLTQKLEQELQELGLTQVNNSYFDTLLLENVDTDVLKKFSEENRINFYYTGKGSLQISLDETTSLDDVYVIKNIFAKALNLSGSPANHLPKAYKIPQNLLRKSDFLQHAVFNSYRSETQMMRYIKQLENKDLSLNTSMISLGSCTMKLNAATEMLPLTWTHWSKMHPFVPVEQAGGYTTVIHELSDYLCSITAFDGCSLQPNSGAQGEYAGLLTIRNYYESRGEQHRNVMLIPISAHGTNPASAVMAGMKVIIVKALENGYIDIDDLKEKAIQHSTMLAGIMITYPSTYGIYEETIKEITSIIHEHGGQVYMDGANMNAQVGITAPGLIGADVCHLNLHKTFAIPHGGGGPGVGPICVKEHLKPFLPGSPLIKKNGETGAVSAAPYGSALILLISHAYIRMLGGAGLKKSTEAAILNANYMRARLQAQYDILYTNKLGYCAHEFIVDLRPFKKTAEVEAEDIAKRLMDYGFHAPTMSFPVPGTIMIEPTESEDKAELDRFCTAMLSIRNEITAIENGQSDVKENMLKHAPHTYSIAAGNVWDKPYSREDAVFPLPYVRQHKFWPSVSRINNTYGDRNLVCTCEPVESYLENSITTS